MQLQRLQPRFDAANIRLVVIGNGPAWAIEGFREKSGFTGELYTDPSRAIYEALDMKRGLGSVFKLGMLKAAKRARKQGATQTKTLGDAMQMGGFVFVRPDGEIAWLYRSEFARDHPDDETIEREVLVHGETSA